MIYPLRVFSPEELIEQVVVVGDLTRFTDEQAKEAREPGAASRRGAPWSRIVLGCFEVVDHHIT